MTLDIPAVRARDLWKYAFVVLRNTHSECSRKDGHLICLSDAGLLIIQKSKQSSKVPLVALDT